MQRDLEDDGLGGGHRDESSDPDDSSNKDIDEMPVQCWHRANVQEHVKPPNYDGTGRQKVAQEDDNLLFLLEKHNGYIMAVSLLICSAHDWFENYQHNQERQGLDPIRNWE
ncbi:hypothetical protein R1flu_015413 [Riccia fluitans]|uniref:Uncharacterized protein n=1 Tax=Riccia fluitans TaxID=41844 RepID=A0ABD1YMP6_9MARC